MSMSSFSSFFEEGGYTKGKSHSELVKFVQILEVIYCGIYYHKYINVYSIRYLI